jgi:FhaA, N-terminal domain/FHA domain
MIRTMGLQQFEGRLERLVEGTLAKPFRSNLQPIEIGRRLTREMDLHRRVSVHGIIAPNAFTVTLAPPDVDRFANFIDALSRELADAAREHARVEGYEFVGPVDVQIYEGSRLKAGRFVIDAEMVEGVQEGAYAELVLHDGSRVAIDDRPVVLGRMPDCDVVLADPNVSRRHAELRRVGDTVVVTDLGSTNGTRVNGEAVRERALASGDEITVGSTTVVFELS